MSWLARLLGEAAPRRTVVMERVEKDLYRVVRDQTGGLAVPRIELSESPYLFVGGAEAPLRWGTSPDLLEEMYVDSAESPTVAPLGTSRECDASCRLGQARRR